MSLRRYELSESELSRIEPLLSGRVGTPGRRAVDNRLFLNAVFWIARSGSAWRDLPERYGKWNTVYQRFRRWARSGRWQRIFAALQEPDLDWVLLDTTVIRAHQHAAGARKKGEQTPSRHKPRKHSDAHAED